MEEVIGEMRGVREEIKEQRGELKKEMEEMRREVSEQELRGREEREEMRRMVGELERRMERLEGGGRAPASGLEGEGKEVEIGRRLKDMERKMEMREREERRKNFLIKGLEVKEGKRREAVELIMKAMGVEIEMKEVRRIGGEGEREMVLVGTGGEEQKREVIRKRGNLRGRREKIWEDWTWRERRMRWRLEEIARREERRGEKVRIGYGRIRIGE